MPKEHQARLSFNRGILSTLAAARVDLARQALSAEEQTNWMPRALGSMMLRPGWGYLGATKSSAKAHQVPLVFAADDLAEIELTDSVLRVWIEDALVTRPTVTAVVTNGDFTSNVTGWTDSDESGGVSAWVTGGHLSLIGSGPNAAIRDQQVTVNEAGVEHALRIVIARGPVLLRVGSSSGAEDYIDETTLGTGTHSLTLTPAGNFYIRLMNRRKAASLVDSVSVESAGILELPTPWLETDLPYIRHAQSADVLYVACRTYQQRKIERRSARSWSIVLYEPETGPFRIVNATPVTLTPSAISGDITLAASKALFRSTHVGALFRIGSTGQLVQAAITGEDQWSDPIRVTGIENQRKFQATISGTWSGTVHLQYSVAEPGSWVDVKSWTGNITNETYDDDLDNQIIYYRIGIKSGNYSSGTANVQLSFASGSASGIVRVTGYTSATQVSAAVIDALGGTTATSDWSEGSWSDRRGWPSAVALHEGRLDWFGKGKVFMSVSDGYEDFDDEAEGDSGPIQRSLGEGPVDTIHWALSLARLQLGTATNSANIPAVRIDGNSPVSARSTSFDEPLTPTNFNLKFATSNGVFVDRSLQRVFELAYDVDTADYKSRDLSVLTPDLNASGITQIAVQHKPDVRIHCIRTDGTVGVLIFDRAEDLMCWVEIETTGFVESLCIQPGTAEDRVYYIVRRTINGSTVRYRERWALESECQGGTLNKQADAFILYSGVATTTITGLSHLNGESVVVWGNGKDLGTYTVSSSQITGLSEAVTSAVVGLSYQARFKPTKHAFAAALGTPLNQRKRVDRIGLVLENTHPNGIRYGPSFDDSALSDIPRADLIHDSNDEPDEDALLEEFEGDMMPFDGEWSTDSRVHLIAEAPRPCTVLAFTVSMQTSG